MTKLYTDHTFWNIIVKFLKQHTLPITHYLDEAKKQLIIHFTSPRWKTGVSEIIDSFDESENLDTIIIKY